MLRCAFCPYEYPESVLATDAQRLIDIHMKTSHYIQWKYPSVETIWVVRKTDSPEKKNE